MGAIEERKALERLSQSMRRIITGAREATAPRPPTEAPPELPEGSQPSQGSPRLPAGREG